LPGSSACTLIGVKRAGGLVLAIDATALAVGETGASVVLLGGTGPDTDAVDGLCPRRGATNHGTATVTAAMQMASSRIFNR
jgi:hypothetical protein